MPMILFIVSLGPRSELWTDLYLYMYNILEYFTSLFKMYREFRGV